MARRTVNDAQRKVLDWLLAGGAQDPPELEMKISAAALKSRGLVRIRRPSGKWTAELTEDGRYYVEHGTYPPLPTPTRMPARARRRKAEQPRTARPPQRPAPKQQPAPPPEVSGEVPVTQVIRRPHPAIKEIRDRPDRLPTLARRRCLLNAHSLVTEALARVGWSPRSVAESSAITGAASRCATTAVRSCSSTPGMRPSA